MAANVNVPTNLKVKEQDVNQKLQLFGIYSAFANGKVPSNKQIDIALNSALASKPLSSPPQKLSAEGKTLVADLKEVIRQAKYLLLTKNDGNLIQEFIWDCQHLDGGNAKLPGAPVDKDTARQHGDEVLEGLKTLGTLLISNGQFRKLLNDASILLRDVAGDAATSAAGKLNPSEDALAQIDQPAEDNTWHDVPDLSRENIRKQATGVYNKNKPFNRDQATAAAQQGADHAQGQPDDQQAASAGANTAVQNLQDQARTNIPDETQEKARNAKSAFVQSSRNYLDKKMPQERRDQTIWRLKKMVAEIQGHGDYQQAIETLLSLAETYAGHGKSLSNQGTGTVKGIFSDNSSTLTKLKTLIERFANNTSLDDLFDALNNIYRDADKDPELKNWFTSVDKFIRRCLQEQGFILQDAANDEYNGLYDKGRFLLRERYRDHTDLIIDEIKFLADQFEKDPQNKAFGEATEKLFLDLGNDENGNPKFKPHLITDLTEVIIPGIFESTRYVPIPRIEVSDPMIDVVVENLVIESDNLFPNAIEIGSDNYWRLGRKSVKSKHENKFMIAASGIQMDLRDVSYYIKKKQGFPSITDKGVMDIILGGEGFSFKLKARNAQTKDRIHFVVVEDVDVKVKELTIKIKQSNHKLLFGIAKPLLLKVMKPAIQKVIEKQVKQAFEQADTWAYGIHQEAQRAIESAKRDPENAPSMYQQYYNALQKKITANKEKAEAIAKDTKVNVAVTQQDSIFKNISLPGGISTKATEYKELAAKGDKWESPVFGIGSSKESTDIPKAGQITRKSGGRSVQVRGANHPNAGALGGNTGANSTTGFSNQVDQAFDNKTSGVSNGAATAGYTSQA